VIARQQPITHTSTPGIRQQPIQFPATQELMSL
jgi:hypothetical protein